MLFKGEEGLKPTRALSGGEAVRLIFAKLMLTKDNVLVLDEPTNHLDLESIVALGDALSKYEGTAFVVTHDRDLIEQLRHPALRLHLRGPGRLPRDLRRVPGQGARRSARGRPQRRGQRQEALSESMDLLATARRLEAIQAEVVRTLATESEPVAGGWMAANGPGSYLNKTAGLGFDGEPIGRGRRSASSASSPRAASSPGWS